jgi:hypothetical protein
MTFEVASFPNYSRAELFDLVVSCYFTASELDEARKLLAQGSTYAEVTSALAERGQDELRRLSCCLTIPGGKVLAHPPDRRPGDLSYISFQLMEIVRAALPPLQDTAQAMPQGSMTLWGQHEPSPLRKSPLRKPPAKKPTSLGRVSFEAVGLERRKDEESWAALARGEALGLGYQVKQISGGGGFWIDLLHLRSGMPVASVIMHAPRIDHERIREWVVACLQVTDWTKGYQTILRQQLEQKGRLKRQILSRHLEAIWGEQEKQFRQQALFDDI